MAKIAFITGVTGQDGSYLAEFLLEKGYEVHGLVRRSSSFNRSRIDSIQRDPHFSSKKFYLHYGDMSDSSNLIRLIQKIRPDEVYNLAAQSHVHVSFETPEFTANTDALGTLRLLEAIRITGLEKSCKFYQASTSELFGKTTTDTQSENTPFHPRSPYGVAKLYAFWIIKNYREAYDIFACNGILFNHESPRRGENFVSKKITQSLARVREGKQDCLFLGNLDARRDWGHAKDYVEAMWLMLQLDKPEDLVIATGTTHSVRDFVEAVWSYFGGKISWSGSGIDEIGTDVNTGKVIVRIDKRYFRPAEVDYLCGDASKAMSLLNWKPRVSFEELVAEMSEYDLKVAKNDKPSKK